MVDGVGRAHPAVGGRGLCAAGHRREAEAGVRMLHQGGNAVDAAVAAAFTGFVVEQVDCGLGGFAHVSVWLEDPGVFESFDGYVRAPAAAHETMFPTPAGPPTYYGHVASERQRYGPLSVAVPGAVAALCEAHARCGRLALSRVLGPALEAAEDGVAFGWRDVLAVAEHTDRIRALPDTAAVLLPGGRPPRLGVQEPPHDRLDCAALRRTLEAIAKDGAAGFYLGRVGDRIADHVRSLGGVLDSDDLASYRPRVVRESPGRYRHHDFVSCLDPVAYEALHVLDGFDIASHGPDGLVYRHLVAEALAVAFTDCMTHYGDPDFVPSPVRGLGSRGFAAARRRDLRVDAALPRPVVPGDPRSFDGAGPLPRDPASSPAPVPRGGTSQMVAADRDGNLVSIITAVGWTFGSLVYVPEAGIFLNNGMSYFDPRPGRPSSIAPGKMPMFGAPALVAQASGEGRFASAGSGGYRIETAVLHALMNFVDHSMPIDRAVAHPRVHCQGGATYVDARIDPSLQEALSALGHEVVPFEEDVHTVGFGRVCAIARDPGRSAWTASAEPCWTTAVTAA